MKVEQTKDLQNQENFKNNNEENPNNNDSNFDNEILLSLLTFADKQKRINIQPEWEKIVNYCNEVDSAKYAHKLCNTSILAIGNNYVIVVVEHASLAADLNSEVNQPGLTSFLLDKLNEELRVFAITVETSQELIESFKTRAADNNLPEKIEVILIKEEDKVEKDSLLSKAEALFGKDGFIIEE